MLSTEDFMPDHCEVEGCMTNDFDNFPNMCSVCVLQAVENLKNIDEDSKSELYFLFKDGTKDSFYDALMEEACTVGDMTKEEYKRIEEEVWNEILLGKDNDM